MKIIDEDTLNPSMRKGALADVVARHQEGYPGLRERCVGRRSDAGCHDRLEGMYRDFGVAVRNALPLTQADTAAAIALECLLDREDPDGREPEGLRATRLTVLDALKATLRNRPDAPAEINPEEERLLPRIDGLTVAQLRRRAADDRDDALRAGRQGLMGCVAMLLADADRCEARADALEKAPFPAAPEGRAFERSVSDGSGLSLGGRPIASIRGDVARDLTGSGMVEFTAHADRANRRLVPCRQPTVTVAVQMALANLHDLARV